LKRALWTLAVVTAALGALAVLVFVASTMHVRVPYWGEAEVLFEAARVRSGAPLFVDPAVGALDRGPPPSRWYVTYPPLLTYGMALVPASAAPIVGRALASAAWLGTLAWIGHGATCRATGRYAALFVAGLWLLANFATVGRPDAIACALAAIALVRSVRQRSVDVLAATLFVLAAWVKPTVLGIPCGALIADAVLFRRVSRLGVAIAVGGAIGVVLFLASGGALVEHVVRSNAQPLRLSVWLAQVPARLPFFAPLLLAAAANGAANRRAPGVAIALGALAASVTWTTIALAKTGSAANYWMEPCLAAVVLLAHARGPFVFGSENPLHAGAVAAHALYTQVGSVRAAYEHGLEYRAEASAVASVRSRCEGPVGADTQGIELALDGRILVPTYQAAWLVRTGRFPAALWKRDLEQVSCYVVRSHDLDAAPEIAAFVAARFPIVENVGPLELRHMR